ncbi:rhodanese-like domain-containing protein [Campylobacter canadensis]|uniref:Cytochrome c3 family protein n=1 Tax=Campylobacter canadensis TaxID=449520 RepID=A0ABS7WQ48_9BACT|nr:rhodanese-like domain-containing protein [Campylobacter canadensis]MBZ7986888.1 cytochrome c3 family protein [Campylobacter canadensis]MBZ7994209.1 cytochrome c3 family protein [Campylobacter canadensis]MBZ7995798.1 cytochrome c3 family protein [Campylobacter canadensis]MBZ7997925.1 cytochrome c3 family protein [Campylobacter canadensis]MBZ7999541.1 cytochrome c3 family protein [Campylobacter canadensis]
MIIRFLIAVFLSLNIFASEGSFAVVDGVVPISMADVEKLLNKKDVYIYDANEKQERLEYGYLPNAIFINTPEWKSLLPENKEATLIFYCLNRMCYASSDAAMQAQELGYKNVFVMLDGIQSWILSARVVEKSNSKPLLKSHDISSWKSASEIKSFTDELHKNLRFANTPSCRDCHGVKGEINEYANDKDVVNNNCKDCHKEVKKEFALSVHNKEKNPRENTPNCSDCHNTHDKEILTSLAVKKLADAKCGSCHQKEQSHYHETFHGKAILLANDKESKKIAACYDCHGTHNIAKVNEAHSTLSKDNRVQTCEKCHEGANENFADFIAHADHKDKENFPLLYWAYVFMSTLVISVFAFFGLHTFLWSMKLIYVRIKYKEEFLASKKLMHDDKVKIKRFSTLHKIQHFFMAASFLGLSFSGLPQKFYTAAWAKSMVDLMGGISVAVAIHHISAFIMIVVFISHILEIIYNAYKNKDAIKDENGKMSFKIFLNKLFGPDSLMPRWQDFKDIKNHFLWFIGKAQRPHFDRFTYWEKFDYLAVFWGMFVIGFSGLVLWYPVFWTKILPGFMLNLAYLVHSDEALLATGFIFAVHFFNTHFRADRFPMDMVIFSGELSESELKHDRYNWYLRLKQSGKLEQLKNENDSFAKYFYLARVIGFLMLFTGLVFLFLIIFAYADYLLG